MTDLRVSSQMINSRLQRMLDYLNGDISVGGMTFKSVRKEWEPIWEERERQLRKNWSPNRKKWVKNNPEKMKAMYMRNYAKIKNDPKYKLNHSMSRNIGRSLTNGKGNVSWTKLVDYTLDDLKKHLKKLLLPDMTWNNYGKWHIDHINPKSKFNFSKPEHPDFKKCWALKNLRPLWAKDNIAKHDKLIYGYLQTSFKLEINQ